jgi:hypothetical protein
MGISAFFADLTLRFRQIYANINVSRILIL